MPYRRLLTFVALFALLPPAGCNKKGDPRNSAPTVGRQLEIEPTKKRPTSLLDRANEEPGQTTGTGFGEIIGADAATSTARGQFAVGSLGIDGLQIAAKSQEMLDMRLLEEESGNLAYKTHFDRGEEFLRRGQLDQALVCFDEAKNIDPKRYSAYVGEAFSYYRKGDFGRAAAAIDFAIRSAPQIITLYNHRAHIRAQLGDFTKAIDDLTHLLKVQPDDFSSLLSRAQFYAQTNNHVAAVADFTTAAKMKPSDLSILLFRGISYYRLGKFRECADDMTTIINQRRDQIDPYFLRGIARAQLNDLIGGRSDYDQAVKLGLASDTAVMWRPRFYPDERPGAGS